MSSQTQSVNNFSPSDLEEGEIAEDSNDDAGSMFSDDNDDPTTTITATVNTINNTTSELKTASAFATGKTTSASSRNTDNRTTTENVVDANAKSLTAPYTCSKNDNDHLNNNLVGEGTRKKKIVVRKIKKKIKVRKKVVRTKDDGSLQQSPADTSASGRGLTPFVAPDRQLDTSGNTFESNNSSSIGSRNDCNVNHNNNHMVTSSSGLIAVTNGEQRQTVSSFPNPSNESIDTSNDWNQNQKAPPPQQLWEQQILMLQQLQKQQHEQIMRAAATDEDLRLLPLVNHHHHHTDRSPMLSNRPVSFHLRQNPLLPQFQKGDPNAQLHHQPQTQHISHSLPHQQHQSSNVLLPGPHQHDIQSVPRTQLDPSMLQQHNQINHNPLHQPFDQQHQQQFNQFHQQPHIMQMLSPQSQQIRPAKQDQDPLNTPSSPDDENGKSSYEAISKMLTLLRNSANNSDPSESNESIDNTNNKAKRITDTDQSGRSIYEDRAPMNTSKGTIKYSLIPILVEGIDYTKYKLLSHYEPKFRLDPRLNQQA